MLHITFDTNRLNISNKKMQAGISKKYIYKNNCRIKTFYTDITFKYFYFKQVLKTFK